MQHCRPLQKAGNQFVHVMQKSPINPATEKKKKKEISRYERRNKKMEKLRSHETSANTRVSKENVG